jgi:hypothetical protein
MVTDKGITSIGLGMGGMAGRMGCDLVREVRDGVDHVFNVQLGSNEAIAHSSENQRDDEVVKELYSSKCIVF